MKSHNKIKGAQGSQKNQINPFKIISVVFLCICATFFIIYFLPIWPNWRYVYKNAGEQPTIETFFLSSYEQFSKPAMKQYPWGVLSMVLSSAIIICSIFNITFLKKTHIMYKASYIIAFALAVVSVLFTIIYTYNSPYA